MGLFDHLTRDLKKKIESFDESGMGYWKLKVFLRDGRVFSNVYVNDLFQLGFPDLTPFKLKDIVDVEWDGYRGSSSSGVPVEVTDAGSKPSGQ
jgi:hypothetical protein